MPIQFYDLLFLLTSDVMYKQLICNYYVTPRFVVLCFIESRGLLALQPGGDVQLSYFWFFFFPAF